MEKERKDVPIVVIKRLPRYYRYLGEMLGQGMTRVSSKHLSEKMGVTASQIRQDLNFFGGFGQQGYGYNIEYLYHEIGEILGLHKGYTTIIIGAGNLGHALANHSNFKKRGFRLLGVFDKNEMLEGSTVGGVQVYHMSKLDKFMRDNEVDIAILAIPKYGIKEVADKLVSLGIKGLWNFSYSDLDIDPSVAVENVHLSDGLMTLSYRITQNQTQP